MPGKPAPTTGIAIDPGNTHSAYAEFSLNPALASGFDVLEVDKVENSVLRRRLSSRFNPADEVMAIEMLKPRGLPTSSEELETATVVGRCVQIWESRGGRKTWSYVFRDLVKLFLTGRQVGTGDSHVRRAVIELFGGDTTGVGGKRCQNCNGSGMRGRGKSRATCMACHGSTWESPPGPLFKAKKDMFAALAVAAYWAEHKTFVHRVELAEKLPSGSAKAPKPTPIPLGGIDLRKLPTDSSTVRQNGLGLPRASATVTSMKSGLPPAPRSGRAL